jgi:hypothetical protein
MNREACVCAMVCIPTCMIMLQKYQFEPRDCSHISCHKDVGISQAINCKSFKFIVATSDENTSRSSLLWVTDKRAQSQ